MTEAAAERKGAPADVAVCAPEEVAVDWQRLWERTADASPFAAPAWLIPWTRHYAPGRCWVAAVRDEGRLAACLPLFWWRETLFLAGTSPSDHGAGLFEPEFGHCAGAMLEAVLRQVPHRVGRIDLQQLLPASPLGSVHLSGWRGRSDAGEPCVRLRLAGSDGMERVSRRWRANWCYAMRRLEREGAVVDLTPADEVPEAMAVLERLHRLRWAARGEGGMFADPLFRAFFHDAVPELARTGMLRLHRLRVAGGPAALLLALKGGRSTCYYLSGFDPGLAHLSPGMALVGVAIAHAAHEGDLIFDFLRGREAYKYRWGAGDAPTVRRVLERA